MTEPTRAAAKGQLASYAIASLVVAVVGALIAAGPAERTIGILAAWAIQCLAFWRLDAALTAGVDAKGAWLGGMAARMGGLLVAGAAAKLELVGRDLPLAYGLAVLVLLMAEAAWLIRGTGRPAARPASAGPVDHGMERTRSAG